MKEDDLIKYVNLRFEILDDIQQVEASLALGEISEKTASFVLDILRKYKRQYI